MVVLRLRGMAAAAVPTAVPRNRRRRTRSSDEDVFSLVFPLGTNPRFGAASPVTASRPRRWRSWGHRFSPDSQRKTLRSDVVPAFPVNSLMARLIASASSVADIWWSVIHSARAVFLVSATSTR